MSENQSVGGQLFWRILREQGLTTVLGLPGAQTVSLYEHLRTSGLRAVLTVDEAAATFMAGGYYRASGTPAAVMAMPGPGFTNTITGLVEAQHDSAGLILVTVKSNDPERRLFSLQDIDQQSIVSPVVKQYISIGSPTELEQRTIEAYRRSVSGEPGPVVVELDPVVIDAAIEATSDRQVTTKPSFLSIHEIEKVVERLREAGKVVLYLGQGASAAAGDIRTLAERQSAAVVTTCSGRGVIPARHPLSVCPDVSAADVTIVNRLIAQSDVVLAIGCKFSHNGNAGFSLEIPTDKLIHVDASDEVLNANYRAGIAIRSDSGLFVSELLARLSVESPAAGGWTEESLRSFTRQCRESRVVKVCPEIAGPDQISWAEFFAALDAAYDDDFILVTDSGMHQVLARAYSQTEAPRGLIVPADFQSMGFGLPAAIGARLAAPERDVVVVLGDGGFNIAGSEIATATREKLSLTIVILNDGSLGLIRRYQLREYGREISVSTQNPNYARIADAFGACYYRFEGAPDELFRDCRSRPGVKIVEVPLRDSAELQWQQAGRLLKETVKSLLPKDFRKRAGGR